MYAKCGIPISSKYMKYGRTGRQTDRHIHAYDSDIRVMFDSHLNGFTLFGVISLSLHNFLNTQCVGLINMPSDPRLCGLQDILCASMGPCRDIYKFHMN